MIINNEMLLEWNKRGLIPGPRESEDIFLRRCLACTTSAEYPIPNILKLYDLSPDWVACEFSDKGLRFWEGGCLWRENENLKIQLRPAFLKRGALLGIYRRDEVLAHELVHASRSAFNENRFEEVLAYQTSMSRFRRYFGPCFHSPIESLLFMGLLLFCHLGHIFPPILNTALACTVLFACFLFFRLLFEQRILKKVKKNLSCVLGKKAMAVLMRLTDEEILFFAKNPPGRIVEYAHKAKKESLRWRQIFLAYFNS